MQSNLSLTLENWKGNQLEKSFVGVESSKDNLEKGISDVFEYTKAEEQFTGNRTGKQIKDAILPILANELSDIETCKAKLTELENQIGCKPESNSMSWLVEKYPGIQELRNFKEYTYDQRSGKVCTTSDICDNTIAVVTETEAPSQDISSLMYRYNDVVSNLQRCIISTQTTKTYLEVIEDNKSYKLSIHQLTKLGL